MSVQTLPQLLFDATRNHASPKAFQRRLNGVYEPVSSAQFESLCMATGLGLKAVGIEPGDRVGILARSSLDWAVADFAIQLCGALSVPIYPTLPAGPVAHILAHSGCRALFVEDAEQAAKVMPQRERLPALGALVQFAGEPGSGVRMLAELQAGGAALGEAAAEALRETALAIAPGADSTLVYTSGTSGDPKGVLLSHANIVSNVLAALAVIPLGPADTALSCLPLSHLLERTAGLHAMLHAGVSIAYAESIDTLAQNLLEVRPTVMIGVPRLYEKLYGRILARSSAGGPLRRRAFRWAQQVGAEWTARRLAGGPLPLRLRAARALADRLVFALLRARTGGRLRFFVSGGAPLAPEIGAFFYAAGLPIVEGYGLTETSPILSVNSAVDLRLGSVGRALPGIELRIAADGEILTRGPQVMQGYFRDPEATRAVLGPDGWFATGDIGRFDGDGFLRITDRKKDLIVTAGGKNVAPQPIESRFKQDRFIGECILIGDRRPFIAALIVPDFAAISAYAARKGLPAAPPAALVRTPAILSLFERRVARLNAGLPPHEQIRAWRLLDHELTLGAGELTPSLKVRRHQVLASYADLVAAIYNTAAMRPAATLPPQ